MKKIFFFTAMALLFQGCSNEPQNRERGKEVIIQEVVPEQKSAISNDPEPLPAQIRKSEPPGKNEPLLKISGEAQQRTSLFLQNITGKMQVFTASNSETTKIQTKSGSVINIPKDAFVNSSGKYERGPIRVEVIESADVADYFSNNLPTVCHGKMLVSGGVMYIGASGEKGKLELTEGKSIEVMLANSRPDDRMMVFEGTQDAAGNVSWNNPKQQTGSVKGKKMSAINDYNWSFVTRKIKTKADWSCSQVYQLNGTLKKKGTESEKKEFEQRLRLISALDAIRSCKSMDFDPFSYMDYYLNAPGDNFPNIDKKVCDKLAGLKSPVYKDIILAEDRTQDTLFNALDFIRDEFMLYTIKPASMPENMSSYGINLESADAVKQLKEKGIEAERAKAIVRYYLTLQEITRKRVNDRRRMQEEVLMEMKKEEIRQITGYPVSFTKLGWINIDRFMDEENNITAEVNIKCVNPKYGNNAQVGMIFRNMKSYLKLSEISPAQYSLGKDGKLPSGEPVKIIAVSYIDNKIYYGERETVISQHVNAELAMLEISVEDLKKKLQELN